MAKKEIYFLRSALNGRILPLSVEYYKKHPEIGYIEYELSASDVLYYPERYICYKIKDILPYLEKYADADVEVFIGKSRKHSNG